MLRLFILRGTIHEPTPGASCENFGSHRVSQRSSLLPPKAECFLRSLSRCVKASTVRSGAGVDLLQVVVFPQRLRGRESRSPELRGSQYQSGTSIPTFEVSGASAYACLRKPKDRRRRWHMLQESVSPSRRVNSRVETHEGVYVFWRCSGRDEMARVRDLSLGGLFIETRSSGGVGATANLDFLVQEGQIRAEAVVRHEKPGEGLGLKFTAITSQDRPHLEALVKRFRSQSQRRRSS